jgi:hypothetical protein
MIQIDLTSFPGAIDRAPLRMTGGNFVSKVDIGDAVAFDCSAHT